MDPDNVEKFFGPYLSERAWGTVREDYNHGDCWKNFTHDMARYNVYLHGEDGLLGWCDYQAKLCMSLVLWNGKDKILKERLFGLTGLEGNHGEDVKELYYYTDNVPDHSYMRALYRYPQSAFPYKRLIRKNKENTHTDPEYELIDTGVFDHDYWDIDMEFAKEDPKTCLCRYTIYNRGKNPATLSILPQIWLRDTWSHCSCEYCYTTSRPNIKICKEKKDKNQVQIDYSEGSFYAKFDNNPTGQPPDVIFTENEAMTSDTEKQYSKDAFHNFIIAGDTSSVNPKQTGTKCAASYTIRVKPGGQQQIQLCLWPVKSTTKCSNFGTYFDSILKSRASQSKKFYAKMMNSNWTEEEKNIAQQAYAGLLWNKQFYCFDVHKWFKTGCASPAPYDVEAGDIAQKELCDVEAGDIAQKELCDVEAGVIEQIESYLEEVAQKEQLCDGKAKDIAQKETSHEGAGDIAQKELHELVDPQSKDLIRAGTSSIENPSSEVPGGNPQGENVDYSTMSRDQLLDDILKCGRKSFYAGKMAHRMEPRRNRDWIYHLRNCDIISMPDKWEFPWYATWDLAFHMIPFSTIDPTFSKKQLLLFLSDNYLHPSGQLPAYEFDFSDANPPVHAWACLHVYRKAPKKEKDIHFLKRCFHKLLLNYTWWINAKKVPGPGHLYGGGFLGMDNISVYDRSYGIPPGYTLAQADGTGWMAFYSLKLFEMALELSEIDDDYLDLAERFLNYFFLVANTANSPISKAGLWDEDDKFFYDILLPHQSDDIVPLCIRSLVGVVPLFACSFITLPKSITSNPRFLNILLRGMTKNKITFNGEQLFLSLISQDQLKQILTCMLKESEFLSPFGIRSLSKHYENHPYPTPVERDTGHKVSSGKTERSESLSKEQKEKVSPESSSSHQSSSHHKVERNPAKNEVLEDDDDSDSEFNDFRSDESAKEVTVKYTPGESICGMFGGNSNWRGPIWLCMNYLFLESLETYYSAYGDSLQVELPTGSGKWVNLQQVVHEISQRIVSIFIPDKDGQRPVHGGVQQYAEEENWRHLVLFYEFFCAESGRGCGASHQTGWTALVVEFLKKKYSPQ